MPRLHQFTSLLLGLLLSAALLLSEYWLLREHDQQQLLEKQQHWGELSAGLILVRLQAALDHSALLAQDLSKTDDRSLRALSELARRVVREDSVFAGVGIVQRVAGEQRDAFERSIANRIRSQQQQHLRTSPPQALYYPVASYLPNDGSALPQGLDLGGIGNTKALLDLARHDKQAVLLPNLQPGATPSRLDIATPLGDEHVLLLTNLRLDKLMMAGSGEPLTGNPLQHVRIVAWAKGQMDQPLLDSQPVQPLPSDPPLFTSRSSIGGNDLLFGAYPLDATLPQLSLQAWCVLALSAGTLLLLLTLHQRQMNANLQLRSQLKRQHQQLEQNNLTLREQIGDRVQSEQALAQSEARQRAILQASSDAIILINRNGHILQVNPAAARLVGQTALSLENLPVGALLSELYNTNPQHRFEHTAQAHEGTPFEAHLLRSDNRLLPVELSLSRVVLPDDWFYVVVCRDISVRKEQEEALIRLKNSLAEQVEVQSRQLAALLDASPMAMAYIVDRCLRQVNKAFLELFQQQGQDVIGDSTVSYFETPEIWERTGKALYSLLNDGKVVQIELRLRSGKDKLFWCRLYGKAVNPSVPKLGTIWVYQDFSAQRSVEDTLRQAKVLAEETSRAKTEFLANMSHELRTPLHAILGFTEMGQLRSRNLHDDKLEQYFARINTSGSRLLTLLNDLLDMAKMEVGRMEYCIGRSNLTQCLREACDEMTPLASRNQLRIYLNSTPDVIIADIDPFRLGQVIRNLLSNAVKFSPAGAEIRVQASLAQQEQREYITVSVEDAGPGIPETELETIFDKFIQSSTTKTGAGGTGLGLAISREIVHAHRGSITAANLPSGGAVFTFTIPRHHPRTAEEGKPDASQTLAR